MQPIELWKMCDSLSIRQAALLIIGYDPDEFPEYLEHNGKIPLPKGYFPIKTALCNGVRSGRIETVFTRYYGDENATSSSIDPTETIISTYDLKEFIQSRGVECEFFSGGPESIAPGLVANSSFYAPKLDAANKAWKAVTSDPASFAGKPPKEALRKWLTDHASEFGLINKDGAPNATGIEEICKVANWKPNGGATPTPGQPAQSNPAPLLRLPPQLPPAPDSARERFGADLDDEIPF